MVLVTFNYFESEGRLPRLHPYLSGRLDRVSEAGGTRRRAPRTHHEPVKFPSRHAPSGQNDLSPALAFTCQPLQRRDVPVRDAFEVATGPVNHLAQDAPGEGGRELGQRARRDFFFPPLSRSPRAGAFASRPLKRLFVALGSLGELGKQADDLWIELLLEPGNQFQADFVPPETREEIGGVLAELEFTLRDLHFDLAACEVQKRTNNLSFEDWKNPCQAPGARAAQDFKQYGFGLIVGGMGGRDLV